MIDRADFAIILLLIEEAAFLGFYPAETTYQLDETVSHYSQISPHYISPINITAVGRGLDNGTILTYTYAQMTRTFRWMASVVPPYRRCKFQYTILWEDLPQYKPRWDAVAEGVYEPLINYGQTLSPTVSINNPGRVA